MTVRESLKRLTHAALSATGLSSILLIAAGCGDAKPPAVRLPQVDPAAVAGRALELYDADKNGSLDEKELAACPPLAAVVGSYDADKNGKLTNEEITARLTRLYGAGSALANVGCKVTLAGRPLPGATVKFLPVEMLREEIEPAEGITDETGGARPAIAAELLPENLNGSPLMQPGLYRVEITHPRQQILARYNTETELGFEVDPTSRGGLGASFSLK
jgi:hypothetical protein